VRACKLLILTLLLIPMVLLSGTAAAQDNRLQPKNLSKNSLDSMQYLHPAVVVADRAQIKIIPAQTLHGKELEKLSVHSVADAIRYFSGVQIKDYGGIGGLKTVNVRSMGSQHVGVFYDGVELGNAQNGIIDLGKFSLDNMESVSLYNGQKSSIFQSAKDFASASSVYLQTRIPVFENYSAENLSGIKKFKAPNNLKVTLKGGSFATINPSVLWEHKLTEKISSSVSAEYLYTSGRYKFTYKKSGGYDTTQYRHNGDVHTLRVEAALFGNGRNGAYSDDIARSAEWSVKSYYYDSRRGYPGASVRQEPGKFINADRQWDKNFFTQGLWRKNFSSFYGLMLKGKYSYDWLHYLSDPRKDVSTMYVNNHYRQHEVYASAANDFRIFKWWNVNLSADLQWNKLNSDMLNFVYPKRYSLYAAAATSLRFSRVKVQASLLYNYVTEDVKSGYTAAKDRNKFTPAVVASYTPFDNIDLNFRAFYKKVFRMPTLNDLYYTFVGSVNLEPEVAEQYNVGAGYKREWKSGFLRNITADVDAYYNEINNKIIAMPASNQFRWTMVNLGYVEIKGIDAAVSGECAVGKARINARLTYTYQKAQDFTDKSSSYYGGQIPYVPWNSGSLILGGAYGGWEANYSFIYTGERYTSQANTVENHEQPWYTSDFSISKSIKNVRLTAEVNNIFNQQYEVVRCYPMPGINFRFIVSVSF
jgi:vitamin B12 transporter